MKFLPLQSPSKRILKGSSSAIGFAVLSRVTSVSKLLSEGNIKTPQKGK
jgi:hypothetical protein